MSQLRGLVMQFISVLLIILATADSRAAPTQSTGPTTTTFSERPSSSTPGILAPILNELQKSPEGQRFSLLQQLEQQAAGLNQPPPDEVRTALTQLLIKSHDHLEHSAILSVSQTALSLTQVDQLVADLLSNSHDPDLELAAINTLETAHTTVAPEDGAAPHTPPAIPRELLEHTIIPTLGYLLGLPQMANHKTRLLQLLDRHAAGAQSELPKVRRAFASGPFDADIINYSIDLLNHFAPSQDNVDM
jgi:hypothetical protein